MRLRYTDDPTREVYGYRFNMHALCEVDVGDDSVFCSALDVFLEIKQEWKKLSDAFRDRDVIRDNYNTMFGEPRSQTDRDRGYFL